jgi:hypothetical protein
MRPRGLRISVKVLYAQAEVGGRLGHHFYFAMGGENDFLFSVAALLVSVPREIMSRIRNTFQY